MSRVHVFYSGRVQGVGFRYTAQRIAGQLDVTGWVKNLPDGRVELLAEGPEEEISKLLKQVAGRFEGYIRDQKAENHPGEPQYKSFNITF